MSIDCHLVPARPLGGVAHRSPGEVAPCPAATDRGTAEHRRVLRFVAAGLIGNAVHAALFLVLGGTAVLPVAVVNLMATAVSTAVTNELHRRRTFPGAEATPWWKGHGTGGAAAIIGLVLSTAALVVWQHAAPGAGHLADLLVVQTVTAVVGTANYLALRSVLRPPVSVPDAGAAAPAS